MAEARGAGTRNYMLEPRDLRGDDPLPYGKSKDLRNFFNGGVLSAGGIITDNLSAKQAFVEILRKEGANGGTDFQNIDMNYTGNGVEDGDLRAPDYAGSLRDAESGNELKVSSHWVPNTTSPGPDGNRFPSVASSEYTDKRGSAPFEGEGTLLSPADSANGIASRGKTLGNYVKGERPKINS